MVLVDRQAEQRRDALAEVAVGEAPGREVEGEHGGEQRRSARRKVLWPPKTCKEADRKEVLMRMK